MIKQSCFSLFLLVIAIFSSSNYAAFIILFYTKIDIKKSRSFKLCIIGMKSSTTYVYFNLTKEKTVVFYGSFLLWGVCKRETSASIDTYNSVEVSLFYIYPQSRKNLASAWAAFFYT